MRCASWLAMLSATSCASSSGRLISSTLIADFLAGELRELVAQLVDLGALLADHDARTTGVQGDDDLARLPLDVDVGDRRVAEARLQVLPEQLVLLEERGNLLPRVPARRHCLRCRVGSRSDVSSVPLVHLLLGHDDLDVAGPLVNRGGSALRRRHEPLELRPFVHDGVGDPEPSTSNGSFDPAPPARRSPRPTSSVLAICLAACFLEKLEDRERLVHVRRGSGR